MRKAFIFHVVVLVVMVMVQECGGLPSRTGRKGYSFRAVMGGTTRKTCFSGNKIFQRELVDDFKNRFTGSFLSVSFLDTVEASSEGDCEAESRQHCLELSHKNYKGPKKPKKRCSWCQPPHVQMEEGFCIPCADVKKAEKRSGMKCSPSLFECGEPGEAVPSKKVSSKVLPSAMLSKSKSKAQGKIGAVGSALKAGVCKVLPCNMMKGAKGGKCGKEGKEGKGGKGGKGGTGCDDSQPPPPIDNIVDEPGHSDQGEDTVDAEDRKWPEISNSWAEPVHYGPQVLPWSTRQFCERVKKLFAESSPPYSDFSADCMVAFGSPCAAQCGILSGLFEYVPEGATYRITLSDCFTCLKTADCVPGCVKTGSCVGNL